MVTKEQIKEALDAVADYCDRRRRCKECPFFHDNESEHCRLRLPIGDWDTEQIAEVVTDEQEHRNT